MFFLLLQRIAMQQLLPDMKYVLATIKTLKKYVMAHEWQVTMTMTMTMTYLYWAHASIFSIRE